jgi:hypothetical protein
MGKQNDEAFGGNIMDTQWKQVKRITLSSIKTFEDLTTRLEDLRDSDTTLSQTVGTNLESVMLKAGYDEDLCRECVLFVQNQPPRFPVLCWFAQSFVESCYHLQLEPCRATDRATC